MKQVYHTGKLFTQASHVDIDIPTPRCIPGLLIPGGIWLIMVMLLGTPCLMGQSSIIRGTFSSGGLVSSSGSSSIHGSLSQSAIGRTNDGTFHEAGFWAKGVAPASETVVTLPEVEAQVGHSLAIPLILESVSGRVAGQVRSFKARIRYNATLLESLTSDASCSRVGDTCVMEITGQARLVPGSLVELNFKAKLGNDTATALIIEAFEWELIADEQHRILKVNGAFALLGVCREGDGIRLIHSGLMAARISISPSPARTYSMVQFTSAESGTTELILFDLMGKEINHISRFEANPDQLYHIEINLQEIPSGMYRVVCRTPSEVMSAQLVVSQ